MIKHKNRKKLTANTHDIYRGFKFFKSIMNVLSKLISTLFTE